MKKRIVSLFLTLAILLSTIVMPVQAALNSWEKTDSIAQNMINAAMAQMGKKNADFNSDGMPKDAWCAYFIIWLSRVSGAADAGIMPKKYSGYGTTGKLAEFILDKNKGKITCLHDSTYNYIVNYTSSVNVNKESISNFTPQVGDLIFFRWKNTTARFATHVGLVYKVDSKYVYYVDGNGSFDTKEYSYKSTYVDTHKLSRTSSEIAAYLRPNYSGSVAQTPATSIVECKYYVTVPANYKLQGYQYPESTEKYRYVAAQSQSYQLTCTKKVTLPGGSVRYFFTSGDGYGIYFDYIGSMSVSTVHNFTSVKTEATCTTQGFTTKTCTCGYTKTDSYLNELGHNFGDWMTVTAASCVTAGSERRTCSRCGEYEEHTVSATGHRMQEEEAVPATCTNPGKTKYVYCSVCNAVFEEKMEIPALEHAFENGVCIRCGVEDGSRPPVPTEPPHVHSWVNATCTIPKHCSSCGITEGSALGHKERIIPSKNPTCTESGLSEGKNCYVCGEVIIAQTKIPAKGHSYVEGTCVCGAVDPDYFEPMKTVTRLAGSSRYETSFVIANTMKEVQGISKFDAVILANSDSFADALAGSYLAAKKNAPILLAKEKYSGIVCDYLNKNLKDGGKIYILGGAEVMPLSILNDLDITYTFKRLSGEDRYETNLEILKYISVGSSDLLVATGRDFADSLSASATGLPILLVNSKAGRKLSAEQKSYLKTITGDIYIIGGESAVSDDFEDQIRDVVRGNVYRISGSSRYETSVKIAERFLPQAQGAVVAFAGDYPDGLCGGPLAYAVKAPLILTKSGKREAPDYTTGNNITSGYVLGGDGLISDGFAKQIFQVTEIMK